VQQAASGTQEVASNISSFTTAVAETSQSASQVLASSGDVAEQATRLRETIGAFLKNVEAA
jgi:methyl-accepting chemotaxis protein